MRILMLEPAARQQHAGVDQRLDHGVVGVALFALVVDDALAGEARRLIGEGAVLIDGVGYGGVDVSQSQFASIRDPDVEVLTAVARRGVDETGTSVVGNMFAHKKRHSEFISTVEAFQRMSTLNRVESI